MTTRGRKPRPGHITYVGSGPGDPGLLTTRAATVLANAALGEGVETHLFFTFWGFDMINKKTMDDLKFTMLGNTATHMPQGLGGIPGMTAMAGMPRSAA